MPKLFYTMGGAVVSFFAPIQVLIIWTAVFVMADLVTGIMAAKKRGEELKSAKLKKTIDKIVWYTLAITLAYGLDVNVLSFAVLYLANGVAGLCCGNELYSIFENTYTITGNRVFHILTQFTNKKITETTSINLKKEVSKCTKRSGAKSRVCK